VYVSFYLFCAAIAIGSEVADDSERRQTALDLHSEFPSEISRTHVQTGVVYVHSCFIPRFRYESTST
jgi:hypothetical protein